MVLTTKARVAEATLALLESGGPGAVSMRRVAEEIGVTPMTVYRHYRNREALLNEVCEAAFAEAAATWQEYLGRGRASDRLAKAADRLLDFALARPWLYRQMFIERREGARRFPDDFVAGRSPTGNLLAAIVDDGMRAGTLRPDDVWATAITVAAQVHGLVALYQCGRMGMAEAEFRDLCRASVRRLLNGIAGRTRK